MWEDAIKMWEHAMKMWEHAIKMWEYAMKWRLHGFTDAESSEGGIPKTRNKRKRSDLICRHPSDE